MFGIKYLFQGISLKDWFGSNFRTNKYTNLNCIINKYYMNFYIACWDDRNKKLCNKDEQRRRVIDQYKVERNNAMQGEFPQVTRFVQTNEVNLE